MFQSMDDVQKFGKDHLDIATKSIAALSKGLQTLASDAADYTRKSFEHSTSTFEKMLGAKSLERAVEIQSEYARSSYEGFVAQSTKLGEMVTDIAKETYKPFEGILSRSGSR
jgi:hypothetical protein